MARLMMNSSDKQPKKNDTKENQSDENNKAYTGVAQLFLKLLFTLLKLIVLGILFKEVKISIALAVGILLVTKRTVS